MKILELLGEPIANGGQEAFVINFINAIDMFDLSIDLLTPYNCSNNYYKTIVENKGGRVYSFNLPFAPGKSRRNIIKPLKKFLKSNHYDVVHIHSGSISVLKYASLAAKKAKVKKIIVHSHCAADRKTFKYRLVKLFSMPTLSLCPTDYCACSQIAGDWKFSKRIAKKKLIILKNGVDLCEFSFKPEMRDIMRQSLGIANGELVIGHVGRFSYQKNHEYLLKIQSDLKKNKVNSKLLPIGSGELFYEVKEQAVKDNILDEIIFVGNVDNVADYMQAMDVFALPSRFEGLPIVGVEAQASGLPCVFSNAITEEAHLTNQVEFLPITDEAVAEWSKVMQLLSNQERKDNRIILKEKGFDINATADKILALYKNI